MPRANAPAAFNRTLQVGGFVPFSTTDFPGKLAAVAFVQGCPWQCVYCHNPHLQPRLDISPTSWEQALAMLKRRVGLLDAVVFSGGEPTLDPALEDAIRDVRALGFQIGLHTGGAYPRRLTEILPLVDWVALDAKAPFPDYERVTGIKGSGEQALTCAEMLLSSGIAHEVRTTIHPDLIADADLVALAQTLSAMGVQDYALQIFRKDGCSNDTLTTLQTTYPPTELVTRIAGMFERFTLRKG